MLANKILLTSSKLTTKIKQLKLTTDIVHTTNWYLTFQITWQSMVNNS